MTKELQDLVWSILPREFKEEVKRMYRISDSDIDQIIATIMLENVFGMRNLTSDAEGEEMICVSRKKVQDNYAYKMKIKGRHTTTEHGKDMATGWCNALRFLFGSKCLPDELNEDNFASKEPKPFKYSVGQKVIVHFYGGEVSTITEAFNDGGVWNKYKVKMLPTHIWNENELNPYEEPKPAEPKFKVGDKVRVVTRLGKDTPLKGEICEIIDIDKNDPVCTYYIHNFSGEWYSESDLEPYTEPEEEYRNLSQDCDKCPKSVPKTYQDSGHSRLNIAAMAMQGILSNIDLFKNVLETGMETLDGDGISYSAVAKASFLFADALLNEAEKGGDQ